MHYRWTALSEGKSLALIFFWTSEVLNKFSLAPWILIHILCKNLIEILKYLTIKSHPKYSNLDAVDGMKVIFSSMYIVNK